MQSVSQQMDSREGRDVSASRPSAVVHVGLHKTGTTSIQAWLGFNRTKLATQGFICKDFLTSEGRIDHALFTLAPALEAGLLSHQPTLLASYGYHKNAEIIACIKNFETALKQEIAAAPQSTYVISTETLSSTFLTPKAISHLDEWMRKFFGKVTYVVYFRRHDRWLESQYTQLVKNRYRMTMEEFVQQNLKRNYLEFCRTWRHTVGESNFHVRLYDQTFLKSGDTVADFAALLGVDEEGMVYPNRTNKAPGRRSIWMLRNMNKLTFFQSMHPKYKLRISRIFGDGGPVRMTNELRQKVFEANSVSNMEVRNEYFPDRRTLFDGEPRYASEESPPSSSKTPFDALAG